mgnify:CR=1 FL=1
MKKEIGQKKKKLEKLILNNYTEINIIIYFLLVNHKLDNIIDKLDEKEVILDQACVVKKGYLTSEEQLLDTLKYLIDCFDNEFWFIKTNRNIIIDCLIQSPKAQELVYSKKYVGDNQYLDYFFELFQDIMIDNFKKILLYSTIDLKEIFKKNKIKNLDDGKNIYRLLKLICLCNCTSYNLIYLFDNHINTLGKNFCLMQLEILFDRTDKLRGDALSFIHKGNFLA